MKYNGKWFKGWGFMRFWELEANASRGQRRANHAFMSGTDGTGDVVEPVGTIKPESWRSPTRATLTEFGALPRGVVYH